MREVVTSQTFKKAVIKQAMKMVEEDIDKDLFRDAGKEFDGMYIFIDKKPQSTLFTFDFPPEFEKGTGKKIYIGNEN